MVSISRLGDLVYTRSGDKGNHCNIGVVCRNEAIYPAIKQHLTAAKVGTYFHHMFDDGEPDVDRLIFLKLDITLDTLIFDTHFV